MASTVGEESTQNISAAEGDIAKPAMEQEDVVSPGEGNSERAEASSTPDDTKRVGEDKEEGDAIALAEPSSPDPPKGSDTVEDSKKQSTPRKKAKKRSKDQKLKVFLLDGRSIDLDGGRKPTTETVVNPAHTESQTLELDFFSVYFYDDYIREHHEQDHHLRQKIFLTPKKQLRAQYSAAEREILDEPWEYQYGVKFYVPDPNNSRLLKDDHSRYLMCLQLCDDIKANRVHVDRETAIRLTAIMLQGKLGDYEEDSNLPGYYQDFPQFQLLPDSLQPENYEAQLVQVHRAKAGYTPSQCDAEFLSIAKDLKRYGEHFFLAKSHRDDSLEECRMVTIGNGCKGVSIYCEGQDEINIPWKDIVKISYKKDKFRIIYYVPDRVPEEEANGKRKTIRKKFYTGQRPQAKRIWKNAVEQHVFFHLDTTSTPNIIGNVFLRSSMRYSFKKTLPSARKNPEPIINVTDRPRDLIPIDNPKDDQKDWVLLSHPPQFSTEDSAFQEEQKVQIDFKTQDQEPKAHRFVIHRDSTGSYELVDKLNPDDLVEERERTFSLSVIDENSKASRVSVCLQIDPPEKINVTAMGQRGQGKGVPVFDSDRMPIVNLGNNSMVTTGTVIQKDGRQLTVGEHSQKYPLARSDDYTEDGFAGPAIDGSEEAEQVKKFLEKEHEIFQRAGVFSPEDSEPEPLASNGDSSLLSDPRVEINLESKGKDTNEVVAEGSAKLASVPSGESADGGVAAGGTDSAAVAEEEKKVKAKEADDDMGFGSWDLNIVVN